MSNPEDSATAFLAWRQEYLGRHVQPSLRETEIRRDLSQWLSMTKRGYTLEEVNTIMRVLRIRWAKKAAATRKRNKKKRDAAENIKRQYKLPL